MGQNFSFGNVEQKIKDFQKKGWKITKIEKGKFYFQTPNGMEYGRPFSKLDDLIPLEIFAEKTPENDVKAEYFSRLYQTYWENKDTRKLLK